MSFSIIIFLLILILVVILIFVFKKILDIKSRNIQVEIDKLEAKKNELIASNVESYLLKIRTFEPIDRINDIYKKYLDEWENIVRFLENDIADKFIEINELKKYHKFAILKEKIVKLKTLLSDEENKIKNLEEQMNNFISKEQNMQLLYENAKNELKKVMQLFYANKESLKPYDDIIVCNLTALEESLLSVLEVINKDNKDQAEKKLKLLLEDIDKNYYNIKKIPNAIVLYEKVLEPSLEQLDTLYQDMLKEKYFFQGLNLDLKVDNIKEKVKELKTSIDKFDLNDIDDKGLSIRKEIEEINNILLSEQQAKEQVGCLLENLKQKINKLRFDKEKISQSWNKLCKRYQINKEDTKKIDEFCSNVLSLETKMVILSNQYEKNQEANIVLLYELKIFESKLKELQYLFKKLCSLENKIKEDETYIKVQYKQLKYMYHRCKRKIEHLPNDRLSDKYLQKKLEAITTLEDIGQKIEDDILDIKVLTSLIENAQHIVIRFYKDTNMLVKAAMFVEKAIIYTNRYRCNKVINRQLARAEYLYSQGDYEDSLDVALLTLESIEPGIYEKLLTAYEKCIINSEKEIKCSNLL